MPDEAQAVMKIKSQPFKFIQILHNTRRTFFVPEQQNINHRIKSLKALSIVFFMSELALLSPCGNSLVNSIEAPHPSQMIFDFFCLIVSNKILEHLGH